MRPTGLWRRFCYVDGFAVGVQNRRGFRGRLRKRRIRHGRFLQEQDYNLEFLCGSDIKFAGRDKFFKSHGDYVIYDYNTAVERKVVNKDDFKWWGFDDKTLYDIAKMK